MFIVPFVDSPREPGHTPWVTLSLIAFNVGIGGVLFLFPELHERAVHTLGFWSSSPTVWSSFTSLFLHAGLAHLFGNMLYLWIYGPNVEARIGRFGFLALYLTSALCGDLLYTLVSFSDLPSVGASGAIAGILGAYMFLFPRNKVRFLTIFFVVFWVFQLPAWLVLSGFFISNLLPVLTGDPSSIAHAAHLGGYLAGFSLAQGLNVVALFQVTDRPESRRDQLDRALVLWKQGNLVDAEAQLAILSEGTCRISSRARDQLRELRQDPFFARWAR